MAGVKAKDPRRVADHFTRRARAEKYPARSVYKLKEVDEKFRLLRPGGRVLDLGCAPGSWLLYAAGRVGPQGLVVGLDRQEPEVKAGPNVCLVRADILETEVESLSGWGPFDVVLSDLAPATTGVRVVDQARSLELALAAWRLARGLLREGGAFLVKVFQGPDLEELFGPLGSSFRVVRRIKPKSSRRFSPEIYGLGLGFKLSA